MKTNLWIILETEDFKSQVKMLQKIQELLDNSKETNLKDYEINIDTRSYGLEDTYLKRTKL